MKQKNK